MIDIKELLDPTIVSEKWEERPEDVRLPFFSPSIFPKRRTVFTDLSFLKGSRGVSAIARLSAFDADYTYIDRGNLVKTSVEMPFTREAYLLDEKEKQRLYELLNSKNLNGARTLIEKVYDDVFNLIERAAMFREYTALSILQDASVNIASTGQDNNTQTYQITYDAGGTWAAHNIVNAAVPWENINANPLLDLYNTIRFAQKETGTVITTALLSSRLFSAVLANDNVNKMLFPNYDSQIVTPSRINEYLSSTIGRQIKIVDFEGNYRSTYKSEPSGASVPFIKSDRVILLPAGTVGSTYFAQTPSEAAVAYEPGLNVSVVDGGVAIDSSVTPKPPYRYEVVASQVALQSFEQMDDVYGISVPV